MTTDLVDRFHTLFRGRIDCYGSWDGRCIKQPLTRELYERHLTSTSPEGFIGVYPLGKDMCSWGCVDIDGGDFALAETRDHPDYNRKDPQWHDWDQMLELATDLCTVLEAKQVWGHIEQTRNGFHVWVFPTEKLVAARTMRRALLAACTAIGYKPNEANPKQESLQGDQVGNYVRAPYPGALSSAPGTERRFVYGGETLKLADFLDVVETTELAPLEACAALWAPPRRSWTVDPHAGMAAEPTVRKLNALGYTIWRDGPLPGSDRSSTLAHLAHICNECGLSVDEAFVVVRSADERHGRKFADREDGDGRIAEMVEATYAV